MVSEAAWFTVLLGALADGTAGPGRPSVSLPFLAIAVPGVVAVLAGGRLRWLPAVAVAVVLAGVTAELVAALTPGVAAWAVPTGTAAVRATKWAAAAAVLVCGRGVWLGLAPPSRRQAEGSAMLGSFVLVAVLARRAVGHGAALERATSDAGWLMVVFFLAAVTAVAWTQVRSVEHAATRRTGTGPGGVWLAVVGVPMLVVVGAALLIGGGGSVVGPGLVAGGRHVLEAILVGGTWLFRHLFNFRLRPHTSRATTLPGTGLGHRPVGTHSNPVLDVLAALPFVLIALVVLGLAAYLGTLLVRHLRGRRHPEAPDEERTTVFSWSHLLAQLAALVRRLRRRRQGLGVTAPAPAGTVGIEALDPTRAAYRRFLVAARAATVGREATETPRELAGRLVLDRRALRALTGAYERRRYGGTDTREPAAERAAEALADELSRRRREEASPGPTPGEPRPGGRRSGPSSRPRR